MLTSIHKKKTPIITGGESGGGGEPIRHNSEKKGYIVYIM
jgi:hypothetical protein